MSSASLKQQWSCLLGASLETCIHHILYVRRVYPVESFVKTRFLGIQCRANRHVQVANYITSTLKTIVPAIASNKANEVYVVIFKNECTVLERHVLRIITPPTMNESDDTAAIMREMEQAMRDLVLRIHSLEARDMGDIHGDSVCFKLCLHIPKTQANVECKELTKAVSQGKWFHPGEMEDDMLYENRRPLQRVSVPRCGLQIELRMHVPLS